MVEIKHIYNFNKELYISKEGENIPNYKIFSFQVISCYSYEFHFYNTKYEL